MFQGVLRVMSGSTEGRLGWGLPSGVPGAGEGVTGGAGGHAARVVVDGHDVGCCPRRRSGEERERRKETRYSSCDQLEE